MTAEPTHAHREKRNGQSISYDSPERGAAPITVIMMYTVMSALGPLGIIGLLLLAIG